MEEKILVKDAIRYKLDIAAITETHIKGESNIYELGNYILYTVNEEESTKTHGTGILVKKELKPKFQKNLEKQRGQPKT